MGTSNTMTTSQNVLLALTIVTWLLMLLDLKTVVGADGRGDIDIFLGLRWILAGVFAFGAWAWIAGLLLVAGDHGVLPGWERIAALLLVPASGIAAGAAMYAVEKYDMRWPLVIPALIPPLMAAFVIGLYQPATSAFFRGASGGVAVWGAVLVLSVSIWPPLAQRSAARSAEMLGRGRVYEEQQAQEKAAKRIELLEKIKTMPPDQHLVEWYPMLEPGNGVRAEALEALKKVERRQGDVIEGLTYGIPAIMMLVPELDLQPTPELCEAAKAYLAKNAKDLRIRHREPFPYEKDMHVDAAIVAVPWFQAHGCDCSEGVAALEAVVNTYLDSPDRGKALAGLSMLKQAH